MKKMYISPINKVVELDMECLIAESSPNTISLFSLDGSNGNAQGSGDLQSVEGDVLVKQDNGSLWDDEW